MLILRPRTNYWLKRPQPGTLVRGDHPLVRKLVYTTLFNENGGTTTRNVAPQLSSSPGSFGTGTLGQDLVFATGRRFRGVNFAGTSGERIDLSNPSGFGANNGPWTLVFLVKPGFASTATVFHPLFYYGVNAQNANRFSLRWNGSSPAAVWFADSPNQPLGQAADSFSSGDVFQVGYTNTGATGTAQWYHDGVTLSTANKAGVPDTPGTGGTWIANLGQLNTNTLTWLGDMYAVWVWQRVLNAFEMQELAARPWDMFQGHERKFTNVQVIFDATGTIIAPAASIAATGVEIFDATGSIVAPAASVSGAAVEIFDATGTIVAPAASISGSAAEIFDATGSVTAPVASIDASAEEIFDASGSVTAPAASIDAAAAEIFDASGSVAAPAASLDASAKEIFDASGTVVAPAASVDSIGKERFTGDGSVTAPVASLDGVGVQDESGTGSITAPPGSMSGNGQMTGGPKPVFSGQVAGPSGVGFTKPRKLPFWPDGRGDMRVEGGPIMKREEQLTLLDLEVI